MRFERVRGMEMCISGLDSGDYTYIAVNKKTIKKSCIQSIARLKNLKTIPFPHIATTRSQHIC
jgi:hypothetical protein